MEYMLKEIKKMNSLIDELNQIEDSLKHNLSVAERKKIEDKKNLIIFDIKNISLRQKMYNQGISAELIKEFAILETERLISSETELEEEKNKYNLSSKYIVSAKTGETIGIKYMKISEKIETIYEHTGEIISCHDSVILNYRDNACNNFLLGLSRKEKRRLKDKYGDDWKEKAEQIYKSAYDEAMNYHIEKTVKKIDKRNEEKFNKQQQEKNIRIEEENNKLTEELKSAKEKTGELSRENQALKKELDVAHLKIEELVQQISKVQKNNKDNLEEYRDTLVNAVQRNSKDTNVFEYTPEEKTKILGALGIQFEYDETKNHGIGIDNDYKLLVMDGIPIEQTARQMMICKNLGIRVSVNFNENELSNVSFENEQQVVDAYLSNNNQHKSM